MAGEGRAADGRPHRRGHQGLREAHQVAAAPPLGGSRGTARHDGPLRTIRWGPLCCRTPPPFAPPAHAGG
ncbi:hypothetical protein SBRY_60034 [Actinacidiphila bryophytorum]|uniref:Uncharacterized protein n=1 Tax=Actinacidiphila bryophytorum TaxID=1436133 RepID=A0A9W4MEA9_9ACTN|nr:hypothetical protein SBRY_60034 [Actinacidiphila bryophytorum]